MHHSQRTVVGFNELFSSNRTSCNVSFQLSQVYSLSWNPQQEIFFSKPFGENIPPEYRDWVSVSIKQAGGTTIPG